MRYIAAYLLLQSGGKANPTASDIESLLGTVGIETDSVRLEKLLSELEGKSINDLIAEGSAKLSSVWLFFLLSRIIVLINNFVRFLLVALEVLLLLPRPRLLAVLLLLLRRLPKRRRKRKKR